MFTIKYTTAFTDNHKEAYYRDLVTNIAKKSYIKSRCGAIIVNKNKILGSGYNLSLSISSKNKSCLLCT